MNSPSVLDGAREERRQDDRARGQDRGDINRVPRVGGLSSAASGGRPASRGRGGGGRVSR